MKILERFGMENCKPIATPMLSQIEPYELSDVSFDPTMYRRAVGSLMYLMVGTRPDIAFVVGRLSQYMQNPTQALWSRVKRVLRYIRGTQNKGIEYRATDNDLPCGYSDADWAGCKIDRRSTTGYVFCLLYTSPSPRDA